MNNQVKSNGQQNIPRVFRIKHFSHNSAFNVFNSKIMILLLFLFAEFLSPESSSMIMAMYIVLTPKRQGDLFIKKLLLPLLVLILLGLCNAHYYLATDIVKDFWYFLLPIITLCTGWLVGGRITANDAVNKLAWLCALVSFVYIIRVFLYFASGVGALDDIYQFRQSVGAGTLLSVWGCLLSLKFWFRPRRERATWYASWPAALFLINLAALIVSGSRTSLSLALTTVTLVFFPSMVGRWKRLYWIVFFLLVGAAFSTLVFLGQDSIDIRTTSGRLANSFHELFSYRFDDMVDINTKYRAFESMMAVRTYLEGTWFELICGHGFGKPIDLQMLVTLGNPGQENKFQFIPILHNGYLYVLVKTGILGLLSYVAFLAKMMGCCWSKLHYRVDTFWAKLAMSLSLGTAIATFVISGPFNKGEYFATFLLLGMALRFAGVGEQGQTGSTARPIKGAVGPLGV